MREAALTMNLAFKVLLLFGIITTLVGTVVGFTVMFMDAENSLAIYFLASVPIGFLITFAALTGWVLNGGK